MGKKKNRGGFFKAVPVMKTYRHIPAITGVRKHGRNPKI
jgi:hypothetical protein